MDILGEMGVKSRPHARDRRRDQVRRRLRGDPRAGERAPELRRPVLGDRGDRPRPRDRLRPAGRAAAGVRRRRRLPDGRRAGARVHDPQARELPGALRPDDRRGDAAAEGPGEPRPHRLLLQPLPHPAAGGLPRARGLHGRRHAGVLRRRRAAGARHGLAHGALHPPGRAAAGLEGERLVPPRPPDERDGARLRAAALGRQRDHRRDGPRRVRLRGPALRHVHRPGGADRRHPARPPGTTSSTTSPARRASCTTRWSRPSRGRATRTRCASCGSGRSPRRKAAGLIYPTEIGRAVRAGHVKRSLAGLAPASLPVRAVRPPPCVHRDACAAALHRFPRLRYRVLSMLRDK